MLTTVIIRSKGEYELVLGSVGWRNSVEAIGYVQSVV